MKGNVMEEKSFLKILRTYFEAKSDKEILVGNKEDIIIPMEWVFTEKLDRAIIERAMVDVLKAHKPGYEKNYVNRNLHEYTKQAQGQIYGHQIGQKEFELTKQVNTKIRDISLKIGRSGLQITVNGLDNWTKAIISEQPYTEGKILEIGEDEFCERILGVLKKDSLQEVLDSLDISDEERKSALTIFAQKTDSPIDEITLSSIKDSMAQAAENLTEYYEYLSGEKEQAAITTITISQRQGTKSVSRNGMGEKAQGRKSPVYPFVEREQLLREMNPEHVIYVDGYDQDGKIIKNVYTTFIYKNPRGKEGYLLVAEPLEGSHSTRVVYMTPEQFEGFKESEQSTGYAEVSKHYLEMSNDEFSDVPNAIRLNHGELDVYSDKIKYVVAGKESPNIESKKGYYNKTLNRLYGQRKLKPEDIGSIGKQALSEEVIVADGILDGLGEPTKDKETRGVIDD